MDGQHLQHDSPVITGVNGSVNIAGSVRGFLDAIIISNEGATDNAGRTVTVTITMANGLTQAFGPLAIGAGQNIYHPRKQALAADLSTVIAGVYERYYVAGKVTVATGGGGAAGDKTKVRIITEP